MVPIGRVTALDRSIILTERRFSGFVSMTKLLLGLAGLPFMASVAKAQPALLSDAQMDKVTAGFTITRVHVAADGLYDYTVTINGITGHFSNPAFSYLQVSFQ
jgi:hypothetical protein